MCFAISGLDGVSRCIAGVVCVLPTSKSTQQKIYIFRCYFYSPAQLSCRAVNNRAGHQARLHHTARDESSPHNYRGYHEQYPSTRVVRYGLRLKYGFMDIRIFDSLPILDLTLSYPGVQCICIYEPPGWASVLGFE